MRPRVALLPIAAVVIAGMCAYRVTRPPQPVVAIPPHSQRALPPRGWELPDQDFRLVKFERFLGRHPVAVLFVDANQLDTDPVLAWLREHADQVYDAGWRIIAISAANPAEHRRAAERAGRDWPFPLLTDMHLRDPAPTPVHHLWSRVDRATGETRPGLFLVDRMGYIPYANGRPRTEAEPLARLTEIIAD